MHYYKIAPRATVKFSFIASIFEVIGCFNRISLCGSINVAINFYTTYFNFSTKFNRE